MLVYHGHSVRFEWQAKQASCASARVCRRVPLDLLHGPRVLVVPPVGDELDRDEDDHADDESRRKSLIA